MSDKSFATAINCMDGRTQIPIINFLKQKYNVDYVDSLTYPGPDKHLRHNDDSIKIFKPEVDISVNKHGSKAIAVVGHYDCAGNPVEKLQHLKDIKSSVEELKSWGFNTEIIGLYVNKDWEVEEML